MLVATLIHPRKMKSEGKAQDEAEAQTYHYSEECRVVRRCFFCEEKLRANDVAGTVRNENLT